MVWTEILLLGEKVRYAVGCELEHRLLPLNVDRFEDNILTGFVVAISSD
ncbi:MAG: hypothetical protein J07HN4v3_02984 [Halonotius sp. J07HN4]|nr:MAG: hypothetical protein J07HN4v3_02984 [Halonotius sp. J07HN4]